MVAIPRVVVRISDAKKGIIRLSLIMLEEVESV